MSEITEKCEQYWNEPGPIAIEEVHAILEFIYYYATKDSDRIEELEASVDGLKDQVQTMEMNTVGLMRQMVAAARIL